MEVCGSDGKIIHDSLSHGETVSLAGDRTGVESTYRSIVHYHVGKIQWNEMIKVSVSTDHFAGSHLRFTFRHCSRNDVKERSQPFAMAFLKLVNSFDGTALKDDKHDLCVYKIEKSGRDFENGKYLGLEEYRDKMFLDKKHVSKEYG